MKKLYLILGMVALIGFCFTPAWAEDNEVNEEVFGVNNQVTWLNPWDFESTIDFGPLPWWPEDANMYGYYNFLERWSVVGPAIWAAPIHLPDGARLVNARLYCYDSSLPFNIEFRVLRDRIYPASQRTDLIVGGGPVFTTGQPGRTFIIAPIHKTIDNTNNLYWARVDMAAIAGFEGVNLGDHRHRLIGVKLTWHRQVSTGPGTPTFGDVDTGHNFYDAIEAMAASGITNGCGDGSNYCPDDFVTRGQMAAFLARALGLYWGD